MHLFAAAYAAYIQITVDKIHKYGIYLNHRQGNTFNPAAALYKAPYTGRTFMFALLLAGWVVPVIIGAVVLVLVIIILAVCVSAYNKFVKMRNATEEAWATIDVYLKKRYDLIPNLVETVKGYAKHESGTLESVIAARNGAINAHGTKEQIAAENALSGTLKTLFAVAEAYPDLKANANFLDLQNQLKRIEGELAEARKYYNANVRTINTAMETFPSNIIAHFMKLERFEYFDIAEEERENVKVSF